MFLTPTTFLMTLFLPSTYAFWLSIFASFVFCYSLIFITINLYVSMLLDFIFVKHWIIYYFMGSCFFIFVYSNVIKGEVIWKSKLLSSYYLFIFNLPFAVFTLFVFFSPFSYSFVTSIIKLKYSMTMLTFS